MACQGEQGRLFSSRTDHRPILLQLSAYDPIVHQHAVTQRMMSRTGICLPLQKFVALIVISLLKFIPLESNWLTEVA
jgi:hypothetical protein